MKTLKTSAIALVIAIGTISAFAFAKTDQKNDKVLTQDSTLYWFDASGNYIGSGTIEEQEAVCPGNGAVCAVGYDNVNNGLPVGPPRYTAEKAKK